MMLMWLSTGTTLSTERTEVFVPALRFVRLAEWCPTTIAAPEGREVTHNADVGKRGNFHGALLLPASGDRGLDIVQGLRL
jgi:hypothetical protein